MPKRRDERPAGQRIAATFFCPQPTVTLCLAGLSDSEFVSDAKAAEPLRCLRAPALNSNANIETVATTSGNNFISGEKGVPKPLLFEPGSTLQRTPRFAKWRTLRREVKKPNAALALKLPPFPALRKGGRRAKQQEDGNCFPYSLSRQGVSEYSICIEKESRNRPSLFVEKMLV